MDDTITYKDVYEIEDGRVLVFKRENSQYWQMRTTINGERIWRSLKTTDHKKAIALARRELYKLEALVDAGQPLKQLKMASVIDEYIGNLDAMLESKAISVHMHKKYKTYGKNQIRSFFESFLIQDITTNSINQFFRDTIDEYEDMPTESTVKMWGLTIRNIFDYAISRKYVARCPDFKVPEGKLNGRRAAFTRTEWDELEKRTLEWVSKSTEQFRYNRWLLYFYIMIMGTTGMRTNDARLLKWKHIDFFKKTTECGGQIEKSYVSIRASGKPTKRRKTRELTGQKHCQEYILGWKDYSKFTDPDDYVFCLSKGVQYDPVQPFRNLLNDIEMLNDNMGEKRTPYSIRHTYATLRLESGVNIHLLAQQMGTSVAIIERHYGHVKLRDNVEKLAQNRSR